MDRTIVSASEELRRLDEEKNLDAFLRVLAALIAVVEAADEIADYFHVDDWDLVKEEVGLDAAVAALSRVLEGEEA
jgi:hypothetical protein